MCTHNWNAKDVTHWIDAKDKIVINKMLEDIKVFYKLLSKETLFIKTLDNLFLLNLITPTQMWVLTKLQAFFDQYFIEESVLDVFVLN